MIQPIGKTICVKLIDDKEVKKEGKLVVADGGRENKPLKAKITHQSGDLKENDVVFIQPYGYTAVVDEDGEEYLIVPLDLILCRLE